MFKLKLLLLSFILTASVFAQLPDFIVVSVSGPSTATPGQTVNVTVQARNQGPNPTQTGSYVVLRMILSPDATINLADTYYLDYNIPISTWNGGVTVGHIYSYTIPSGLSGTYYWGGYVDATTYWNESNENNNAYLGNSVQIQGLLSPPTLVYPINNQIVYVPSFPGQVIMQWQAVSGATGYQLEIDGIPINIPSGSQTTYTATLNQGSHQWRARTNNSSGSGSWSSYAYFSMQQSTLSPPTLVYPINNQIVYVPSFPGQVIMQWQAVSGATGYQLEIDGIPINIPSGSQTTYTATLNQGSHQWRARTNNSSGSGSWSSYAYFSMQQSTLSPPTLVYPINNQIVYVPSFPGQVIMQWQAVSGATGYQLEIDGIPINIPSGSQTTYTATLNQGSHQWRARTNNSSGSGSWSSYATFSMQLSSLPPPTLVSPIGGTTVYVPSFPGQVQMQWQTVSGAIGYQLEIDGIPIDIPNGTQTTYTATLNQGSHQWRARTEYAPDQYGSWSSYATFSMQLSSLPPPALVSPIGGTTVYVPSFPGQVQMQWQTVSGAIGYQLEIDGIPIDIPNGTQTTYTATLNQGSHQWRARTEYAPDQYGSWSSYATFSMQLSSLPPPTLVSPIGGTTVYVPSFPGQVQMQWQTVSGAIGYQLEIDGIPIDIPNGTQTTYTATLNQGSHQWRARTEYDPDQYGDWSLIENFSLVQELSLISPLENANIYIEQIYFSWADVGAVSYDIIIDNNSGLGSAEINQSTSLLEFAIDTYYLEPDQTFYWKVIAHLSGGSTIESSISYFNYFPPKFSQPIWIPFYRYFKSEDHDHFYCTTDAQRQIAINAGYVEEGIEGFISAKPFDHPNAKNIFRLYSNELKAHFYTNNGAEKDLKIIAGFTYEGIVGFSYGASSAQLVPMYQLQKDFGTPINNTDYFYTISWGERDYAINNLGYVDGGIMTYVSPNSGNLSQPLTLGQMLFALGVNTQNGNFQSPIIKSFNIPGKGIPLQFEHYYNSLSAILCNERTPLSPGWTHTYNAYVHAVNPTGSTTLINVVWPDGNIHEYYKDGTIYTCLTPGVYDLFEVISFPLQFRITKKDQTVYEFQIPVGARWGSPATLSSIKDRNGNTITFQYNAVSTDIVNLTKVIGTAGRELNFTYYTTTGRQHLIQNISDPIGRNIHFEYDTYGNLSQFTDAELQNTQYQYTSQWQEDRLLTKIILPRGNTIENTYDTTTVSGSTIKYVKNQKLNTSSNPFQFNFNPTNKITTVTDPQGQIWQFTRGANNLVTSILNTSIGLGASFERNDSNNPTLPTRITDGNGNNTYVTYDLRGNALQISQPLGILHQFTYDAMNNVTSYNNPRNFATNYVYNSYGNLTSVQDPRGTTNLSYFLPEGLVQQITNPLSHSTTFTYNGYGNVATISDPLSNTTQYVYDGVSRLTTGINPKSQTTTYTYDKNDNLKTSTDPSGQTTYGYDVNQNLTSIINAKGQQTTFTYDPVKDWLTKIQNNAGNHTDYSYHDNGLLQTKTDPNSNNTGYTYDLAGRLKTIISPSITATLNYDNNNNLTSISETHTGGMQFGYDGVNRLLNYQDFYGNQVNYIYDAAGNVTDMVYPGNKNVHYVYDNDNRLHSITDWNSKTTTYTYRADGTLYQINYPNGVVSNYSYDNAERVTGMNITGPGGTIAQYTFTLDALGSHTQENINQPLSPVPNLTSESTSYTYDIVNRIQSAGNTNYSIDANGNLTSRNDGGNITNFGFNAENKLTNINASEVTFTYDVFGNRRAAVRNSIINRYVLDIQGNMSQVIMETDQSNSPLNYYLYGIGLVARIKPDGTTHYYHGDFRGSVVAMTNAAGTVTHKYSYDAFGNINDQVEPDYNPFKYVGIHGVMEETHGLQFMRARYYEPKIGRFISEDPQWEGNLYSYANSNPISLFDPNGTSFTLIALDALDLYLSNSDDVANFLGGLVYDKYLSEESGYYYSEESDKMLQNLQESFLQLKKDLNRAAFIGELAYTFTGIKGSKTATKIFGKTGKLKLIDMRTRPGRVFKKLWAQAWLITSDKIQNEILKKLKRK